MSKVFSKAVKLELAKRYGCRISGIWDSYSSVANMGCMLCGKPGKIHIKLWGKSMVCVHLESSDDMQFEFDHIVPLSRGGKNDIHNCQILCRRCNRGKHNKSRAKPIRYKRPDNLKAELEALVNGSG